LKKVKPQEVLDMVKRIVLGLLVLAAVTGVLGAQEDASARQTRGPAKIAVSLDLFPLAKGIIWSDSDADNLAIALSPGFEYLVHPHFTVGAVTDFYFGKAEDINFFYFGITAHGRWYPLSSSLDKFFLDTGLGFNLFALDGEIDPSGFSGLTMSLKAGYKLMFTRNFFIEPSMAYVYSKANDGPTPLGWQPGLSIGGRF
jgi:hypothetical protein